MLEPRFALTGLISILRRERTEFGTNSCALTKASVAQAIKYMKTRTGEREQGFIVTWGRGNNRRTNDYHVLVCDCSDGWKGMLFSCLNRESSSDEREAVVHDSEVDLTPKENVGRQASDPDFVALNREAAEE